MRSVPGLLSVFLIAAGVACAELPPDLPPASPLPFAPGPVIGGTIKGNPAAGIVPVKDLIEANRKDEYIPMAEPIPERQVLPLPWRSPSLTRNPFPGKRTCTPRYNLRRHPLPFPPRLFPPFRFLSMKPA